MATREHRAERIIRLLRERFYHDLDVLVQSSIVDGRPMFWLDKEEMKRKAAAQFGPEAALVLDRLMAGQAGGTPVGPA